MTGVHGFWLWGLVACSMGGVALQAAWAEEAPGVEQADWVFLENESFRLGLIKSAGGAMGYFSKVGEKKNLLNHYDRGRLIQQSYYGDADGSMWGDKSWRLNPVQGGDYQGAVPPLVETKVTATTFYGKSIPLHWATGAKLADFVLEQWIELRYDHVHARFRMTYRGTRTHAPRHQELPAVFLNPSLSELVLFQGPAPWTGQPLARKQPGQTNEYFDLPERWAAFVDESGHGVGVCVPTAPQLTSYRFRSGAGSDCSYLAPIATFALQPNMTFEYDAYFFIGNAEEIRARCEPLARPKE